MNMSQIVPQIARFNGASYEPGRDNERLTDQLQRVFNVMCDGEWHKLCEIATRAKAPEASVSAQLRHLRKERFGGHTIEREYIGEGLHKYRMKMKEQA